MNYIELFMNNHNLKVNQRFRINGFGGEHYFDRHLEFNSTSNTHGKLAPLQAVLINPELFTDPKKYYLRAEGYGVKHGNYLNMRGGKYLLNSHHYYPENKVQFTEAEIEQMPKWCQALERIEVEE